MRWFLRQLVSIVIATLIAGFAGHDLAQLVDIRSGPIIGFTAGTLAAIRMAKPMVAYFVKHPERGVEF